MEKEITVRLWLVEACGEGNYYEVVIAPGERNGCETVISECPWREKLLRF